MLTNVNFVDAGCSTLALHIRAARASHWISEPA
jgi:hypothetical protein